MSIFVDAVSLTADLIHDPAIHPALSNFNKRFRHIPSIISSGNHAITVRSDLQSPSSAASVNWDSNLCSISSKKFKSGQGSKFLENTKIPAGSSSLSTEFTTSRQYLSDRFLNVERLYDELNDKFAIQFQDLSRTFDVQFDRLHSILDSSALTNDLKVCHLPPTFKTLNCNFSNSLGSSKSHDASPIPILPSLDSAATPSRTPSFLSSHALISSPVHLQDNNPRNDSFVSSQSLSSSIILVQEDQHRLDESTRAMINLDLKKLEPNGRIQDRDSALLFFRQWRVYVNAGGTKSLRLLLEKPTDPTDPSSTNIAGLGLYLFADPDKLQSSLYLEEFIMAFFSPSPTDLTVIQRLQAF